jgi:hypothetical protein
MADHRDGPRFPGGPVTYPLTTKLLDFYQGLPPGQQAVMASIMTQAASGGEVQGFNRPTDIQEAMDDALHAFTEHMQTSTQ